VQRGHAIANGLYVAAVNRSGREPGPNGGIDFWGHSFCVGPQGEWLAECGQAPTVSVVACARQRITDVRRWWPFLRDRRIDLYGGLTRRYLGTARQAEGPA
jgi:N-carbamoylputrescine amidase